MNARYRSIRGKVEGNMCTETGLAVGSQASLGTRYGALRLVIWIWLAVGLQDQADGESLYAKKNLCAGLCAASLVTNCPPGVSGYVPHTA